MQWIAYPCLIMASVVFYVGLHHLLMFFKRRESNEQLPFALFCFAVGCYDLFCVGLYNSTTIDQGIYWQRFQLWTVDFISVFLIWFVSRYTKQTRPILSFALAGWFAVLFVLSLILDGDATLSTSRPAIKQLAITPNWTVVYYEVELGWLYLIGLVSSMGGYALLLVLLIRYYRRTHDQNALFIIFGQLAYFLGAANDSLVGAQVYVFIYVSEYAFLIIVASMAYVLLNEFVALHHKIEHLNHNLEKIVDERTREIQSLNENLKHQIDVDGLTGIYNRRFFNEYLEIETRRAKNQTEHRTQMVATGNDMNFGLAIMDIDNFKQINDTYGHLVGDKVLIDVVEIIKANIFSRDIFCRYGGEEFVVIFTRTSSAGIVNAVNKIQQSIAQNNFFFTADRVIHHLTISIGVVLFAEVPQMNGRDLLKIADDRLYVAKTTGKNKVVYEG